MRLFDTARRRSCRWTCAEECDNMRRRVTAMEREARLRETNKNKTRPTNEMTRFETKEQRTRRRDARIQWTM
ncbi:hypothetical protein BDR06DRAFT_953629, partial [Suillus hirtellus]